MPKNVLPSKEARVVFAPVTLTGFDRFYAILIH